MAVLRENETVQHLNREETRYDGLLSCNSLTISAGITALAALQVSGFRVDGTYKQGKL
jgi:hypothetical protein